MTIKTIIFDLDDTLLDTWGLLVAPAAREACKAMISAGLNANLESAVATRAALFLAQPRADLYQLVVDHFGVQAQTSPKSVRDAGHEAYYHRDVEPDIALSQETHTLLTNLSDTHNLYLVTSGHPETQRRKVELLKIEDYFLQIHYVHRDIGMSKHATFSGILEHLNHPPEQVLCVGDRPDREIRAANLLGMITARVCKGEFSHLEARNASEKAHHSLESVLELPALLQALPVIQEAST